MANNALMTPLEKAVWEFLRERFAGPENAVKRETIIARFNLVHPTLAVSDRVFRDTVSVLVKVYKKAICTTSARGYFVARTMTEKKEALNYLGSVLAEIGDRFRALDEADPLESQENFGF